MHKGTADGMKFIKVFIGTNRRNLGQNPTNVAHSHCQDSVFNPYSQGDSIP